ncbi:MAG: glycosyltransferase [Lachnospiraceae bacterium]|nr:glycosyltransferase [Lachnospiraceae bacterium]
MNKEGKTIAFYIGSLARGGAEHVIVNLASYFCAQGYKTYIVTKLVDEPEYPVPDGVIRMVADITDTEITASRVKNLKNRILKLRGIWQQIRPDIIISFIRKNNLMALASAKPLHIPVVVAIRSDPARELQGRLFKLISFYMFRSSAGIVMQTKAGVEYLPSYLKSKAVVMPNSVDSRFMKDDAVHERKREIALVGRIDDNKNQKMVLEAFRSIKEDYPDWSLHLYGDGERKESLQKEYADRSVIFHGQVEAVDEYLRGSSIFVLPSRREGMPNALIEAMALGVACISSDCPCGGPADLIVQGKNGILIPVDDIEELKKQLKRLMDHDDLREEIGKEATLIRNKLSPQRVNLMWKEYIDNIISK